MNELTPEGKFSRFGITPNLRRPKYLDAKEFAIALLESHDSLSQFLEWGYKAKNASHKRCFPIIQEDLQQESPFLTYYLFDKHRVVGTASFGKASQINGIQITYWIRKSYQGLGLGTWLIQEMKDHALLVLNYDFVEIHTDSSNLGSIRMALGAGAQEWFRYEYETKAWGASGEMIVWGIDHPAIKFEKRVNRTIVGQLHRPSFGSLG
jgi:RimJ/RimL family protein N-acetyltransferase